MKKNKIQSIVITVLMILILIVNLITFCVIYANHSHSLSVKEYEVGSVASISLVDIDTNITKKQATKLVKNEFNIPHFKIEKRLKNKDGNSTLFLWTVYINTGLCIPDYIYTYAHELTHLKYWSSDETFVTYKTITILYESSSSLLRDIAFNAGINIIQGAYSGTEYDCGYYLLDYFKNKGAI